MMAEISNVRGSAPVDIAYLIFDGRAHTDEDSAQVLECISSKEFKNNFSSDLERLEEYATESYGDAVVKEQ